MVWAWIIAGVLVVLGLGAVVVGWRGRRVNDHPICRKCGFDLVGLSAPEKCPECGRSVTGPRAVRVGERRRRYRTLVLGVLALLVGLCGMGVLGASVVKGTNWNKHKPDWLLVEQAGGWLGRGNQGVLSELLARSRAITLSDERLRELARRVLVLQADRQRAWDVLWGDLFVSAHNRGLVSDQEREQFLRGIWNPRVSVRPRVRTDVMTLVRVKGEQASGTNGRGPSPWQVTTSPRKGRIELVRDGKTVMSQDEGGGLPTTLQDPRLDGESDFVPNVAAGRYLLRIEYSMNVAFTGSSARAFECPVRVFEERSLELTEPDEPTVTLACDQQIASELARSFSMTVTKENDDGLFSVEVAMSYSLGKASPAVAMKAVVRVRDEVGARRYAATTGFVLRSTENSELRAGYRKGDIESGVVDFVLMPSESAGENEPDVLTIWDGALVFESVSLEKRGRARPIKPTRVVSPAPKNVEDLFKKD